MIPKIIHYCWLSNDPIPESLQTYMQSWRRYLPDFEFILWDFNRFDKSKSIWVQEAFERKKYAFAADYIRLYAVYNYGGFYLDMDVEIVKSLKDFLDLKTAICWQDRYDGFEAACFGAEKGSPWLKTCLDYYQNRHFIINNKKMELKPLPNIMEDSLKQNGYIIENAYSIEDVLNTESERTFKVLPSDYFSPKSIQTGIISQTNQTYSIHHFTGSWVNPYDNLPLYAKIWRFLHLPNTNIREKIFRLKK